MAINRVMERTPICCTFASLVALLVLLLLPVRSWCKEDNYRALSEANTECCEDVAIRRFDDIDYDSFVSLMGRRSAAQTTRQRNAPMSRKRQKENILADLLWRRTRKDCVCTQKSSQRGRG
ncbi:tachykinin-3b [Hippoglossus hippoglossus]|uniref:tachykinin-3b n=1 Tax=Hippoglossus hippoglossus TaxID=8267 RepID=UPI00148D2D64|nr:tachykinin-3b [Hippoglossus hippoglossus]